MIRVLVNGAQGRMGQTTVNAVQAANNLELVASADKQDNLKQLIQDNQIEVVVDFTTASAGINNITAIIDAGARPVIGTSGFVAEQVEKLQQQCAKKKLGGIIAPNFSIGAVLMMQAAQLAARYLPQAEIIEYHHTGKQDSPSGTAIKTAEMIARARQQKIPLQQSHEIIAGSRGAIHEDIAIHAVRLPGFIASQSVIFGGNDETLTIRHDSISRESFMPGVILACEKVMKLDHLVYGLENIL